MVYVYVEEGVGPEKEDRIAYAYYRHIDAAFDDVSEVRL